jgi:hypothetical protein
MKSKTLLAALVISMTLTVGSAFGQTLGRVNIPFDFSVGNSNLPAGEYTVNQIFDRGAVLAIRSADGRRQIPLPASTAEYSKTLGENKLVFRCYGDQHVLSQIWTHGRAVVLPARKGEHEMARSSQVQVIAVLLK